MERVIKILKQNGWSENRKIDINDILKYWYSNKYDISTKQKIFVENFGMLEVVFNNHHIKILPLKKYFKNETLQIYSDFLHTALIPVGELLYENSIILIGYDGKIYCAFEEFICISGNDFYEFIKNILDDNIYWDEIEELK